ncbi:MAG: 4'-phosphopantetheinyl transferase superfamily protein [Clostridiales Family XIII bacterium]|jgi:phosphopantetheinyl transferase|nr:4'-phosphopantetheinyl transferase superfamily protein [Clostridiales Family XIII bacterium]
MKLYLHDIREERGGAEGLFRAACADYCENAVAGAGADLGEKALKVARGPHGKPYFAEPPLRGRLFFSISHSGSYWAVVFHDAEAGLDIEDMGIRGNMTQERMEKIAARFFADDEVAYLLRVEGAGPEDAGSKGCGGFRGRFFRIWTAKESYIKYTGAGLSKDLRSFSVLNPPDGAIITTFSPAPSLICSHCAGFSV